MLLCEDVELNSRGINANFSYLDFSQKKHDIKKCIFKNLEYIKIGYQENIHQEVSVVWTYMSK